MSDKTSDKRLLNCPFCGGKATMKISPHGAERWVLIQCSSVGCVQQQGFCRDQEEAIKQWNTRKSMQEIVERLEEKTEQLLDTYIEDNEGIDLCLHIAFKNATNYVKEIGGMND